MPLSADVFVYAPGIGASSYEHAMREVTCAAYKLDIWSHGVELKWDIDEHHRIGCVYDQKQQHIIYVPLFLDYHPKTKASDAFVAQYRDLADILWVHYSIMSRHKPRSIHFLGHSRGGGAVISYLGLLWYDPDYLYKLARDYWSQHPYQQLCSDVQLHEIRACVSSFCVFSPFNDMAEVVRHKASLWPMPAFLRRRLMSDPETWYRYTRYICSLPWYDWHTSIKPCNMILHIPAHVGCILVHADQDPVIPAQTSKDLYRIRASTYPDNTYLFLISGQCHIIVPYKQRSPEVIACLSQYAEIARCYTEVQT